MNKRYLILGIALAVVFVAGACLCSQCSNPLSGLFGPSAEQQRIEENVPIVSGADLGTAVMAKGIGESNSPIGVTDTFSASEDIIYCVVPANYIESGTKFFARWYHEGKAFEDSPELVADRDYSDTYIEFHIEPVDFGVLEAGDYACKIYVNGNPVQTVDFQVR